MKSEGSRGRDGFIHDDNCEAGNGSGTVSGTGSCTCPVSSKIQPLTKAYIWDPDIPENNVAPPPYCNYCRKYHEGDCPWKGRK